MQYGVYLLCVDLFEATRNCMDLNPSTFFLEVMHDIKSWISPHLNELHGHRDPHCFKFVLNDENKCAMYYRNWTSDPWCLEDKSIIVLKVFCVDY